MSKDEASRYYTLLRDPARRKIVEILGEQGKCGFKELRSSLGLGVGTVYYHLDMLSDFVAQDKSRKYMLNDRGQLLFKSLKEGTAPPALNVGEALSHRFARWLFLSPVYVRMTRLELSLPIALAVLLLGAVCSAYAQIEPLFLFYSPSTLSFESIAIMFIFYWVGLFIIADVLCHALFRRAGNDLQLFAALGFSALPLAVYPFIYMFISITLSRYVLLVFQVWTLLLISSALSFAKGMRLDRSILPSLLIFYINIVLLILLGRLT
jgi:DNA-binding transcriptional ArsR family regulator